MVWLTLFGNVIKYVKLPTINAYYAGQNLSETRKNIDFFYVLKHKVKSEKINN